MSVCENTGTSASEDQVLLAFGLTTLAGLATTLGALVPIFVSHTKPKYLASALSFAAGVMLYVSFVEIMKKSQEYLSCTTEHSALASVGCFFAGVVGTMLLHLFVHKLEEFPLKRFAKTLLQKRSASRYGTMLVDEDEDEHLMAKEEEGRPKPPSTCSDPSAQQIYPEGKKQEEERTPVKKRSLGAWLQDLFHFSSSSSSSSSSASDQQASPSQTAGECEQGNVGSSGGEQQQRQGIHTQDEKERLKKMGVMTALAIGLHNFPEGMAAFVATLSATSLGVAVTFAVAIHNIPEGVCVSMPLYYATGSKTKAFFWAFISGISEPIGALVCYLIFYDGFNSVLYGVLFGMIAGMMVFITLKELLPTAHKYDTSDAIVTPFIFVGMAVMGGSLILFEYT
jgi:ZIP family zinc transporter